MNRKNRGITLIALIITIIILIILAAVAIYSLQNYDLLEMAIKAEEEYKRSEAEEKLMSSLAIINTYKVSDKDNYNEDEYLDNKLAENGIIAKGDIAIVNGYQFNIDRKSLKIIKGERIESIQILAKSSTEDYITGNIHIEVKIENEIQSIMINGENVEIPEVQDKKYVVDKKITRNGEYTVLVKDRYDNYNKQSIEVKDIVGEIYDIETLKMLGKKVNEGVSFKDKTIKLETDLNLKGSAQNKWTAIGTSEKMFQGTFEGNGFTIENLYVDNATANQGLFGYSSGTIQNLNIKNGYVNCTDGYAGLLCGYNAGTIDNIKVSGIVSGKNNVGGVVGFNKIGAKILNCKNSANVNPDGYTDSNGVGRHSRLVFK